MNEVPPPQGREKPPPDPDLLALLRTGRRGGRAATRDAHLQEDAASHAVERLIMALRTPDAPAEVAWHKWVETTAFRYAKDESIKAQRRVPVGRVGTFTGISRRRPGGASGDGKAHFERALLGRGRRTDVAEAAASDRAWQEVLETMAPLDQRLILGKYVDGLTTKELAAVEGLSSKAVEHRLARAKQQLRDLLGRASDPFGEQP